MAIYLYSGTPGSGKSLHAAKTITDWFRKGKPVITNFDLDLSQFPKAIHTSVDDDELTPDFLLAYSLSYFADRKVTKKDEDTILLVIDECQLMFNSREYQKKDRKIWIKFFTQHRKLGYRVILIAQMDKMLDKQIRGVIEYEYIHRKLSNFGKAGKLLTVAMAGETFTAVQMWYPLKLKIGTSMFRAKKKYYSIYDSYVTFGTDPALPGADEVSAEPAQEGIPAPEPKVVQGEVVEKDPILRIQKHLIRRFPPLRRFQKWAWSIQDKFRKPKKKKKRRRSRSIPGSYQKPWGGKSLYSGNGKYLRPGGRSQTGWLPRNISSD